LELTHDKGDVSGPHGEKLLGEATGVCVIVVFKIRGGGVV
jgi:hypothetical protein